MNLTLQNKCALVTGGSRGIGAAIVKRLAREGANVVLTYVSKSDQANETVKAAQQFGVKALAIQAESADANAVLAAVERTVEELGRIDILVNSAGIAMDCQAAYATALPVFWQSKLSSVCLLQFINVDFLHMNMASMVLYDFSESGSFSILIRISGTICQETLYLSLSQPRCCAFSFLPQTRLGSIMDEDDWVHQLVICKIPMSRRA